MRALALLAAAALLVCHLLGIYALAGRPMHYDENEYMHTSWLMAAGKRIYRDFFEDHPPHLGILLQSVRPAGDLHAVDVRAWTVRARLLSGAFGTIALLAIMLFAWRMTRTAAAPIVAAATLLASSQIWARGLTDIRAEAPTLALFWCGVVLLTWTSEASLVQALRAGSGIGLIFFANVWNPKWPLESLLMGVLFLHGLWTLRRARWIVAALASAAAVALVAVLPLFTVTTFRDFVFFNFQLRASVVPFSANPWVVRFFEEYPVWTTAAAQHRWYLIVAALAVVIAGLVLRRLDADRRLAWIAVALAVSALLEFRFVYWYPYLWAQYLVMVATTAALVYALLPSLLPSRVRPVLLVAAALFALVRLVPLAQSIGAGTPASWTRYWTRLRAMQTALGPNDTVWISPPRHPVAAFDASYYWYNFRESAPPMIRAAAKHPEFIPPTGFGDLPPCRPGTVKFIELGDWMPYLDGVCRCVERAARSGRLSPTDSLAIFEVDAARPPTREGEAWMQRTRGLWLDMCRRQEVFLRGGQLNITP